MTPLLLENATKLHGLLAEFDTPEEIVNAATHSHSQGYRQMEAYTPYHVEGLAEALGSRSNSIALIVLLGGILGAATGYGVQFYCNAINYPINAGGRPLNSLPSFIPITFELTILFASFAAFLSVFFLNGLPSLWRPVFGIERFKRATKDGFFLCIEARDSKFQLEQTKVFLESLGARAVYEVTD